MFCHCFEFHAEQSSDDPQSSYYKPISKFIRLIVSALHIPHFKFLSFPAEHLSPDHSVPVLDTLRNTTTEVRQLQGTVSSLVRK